MSQYPVQRATLITLGVADLDRAKRFYAALGWTPKEDLPEAVFYQINGMALGFFGLENLAKDQGRPGVPLGVGGMTLGQNFDTEQDVDAAFARAIDAGATALKQPEKVFWGGYSGYYADPDGHVWEVAMNPFWPLDDNGSLTLPDAPDAN
jgi:predicted lactoylglutathione lyase